MNPNIAEAGKKTRFTSENQPEGKTKKNRFQHLRDEYELNKRDIETLLEFVLSLTVEELKILMKDDKKTALEKAFATAVIKSITKGDLTQIDKMLDRKIGKVPNTMTLDNQVTLTATDEELKSALIKKLVK